MRAWPPRVQRGAAAPTAFLDRDGTINRDRAGTYITRTSQLKLYSRAPEALRLMTRKGYRIVVVTNQSGVARGYMTLKTSLAINKKLLAELRRAGARLDAVYFCPHAPSEKCACRKPAAGLILEALKDRPADMPRSFMAGDKDSDLRLARNAGLKGFLVLTGQGGRAASRARGYRNLLALARALPDLRGTLPAGGRPVQREKPPCPAPRRNGEGD